MNDTYTFHDARLQEAAEQGWIMPATAENIDDDLHGMSELAQPVIVMVPTAFGGGHAFCWSSVDEFIATVSSWQNAKHGMFKVYGMNPGKPMIQSGYRAVVRSDESIDVSPRSDTHIWPGLNTDDCYSMVDRGSDGTIEVMQFSDESADHALKLARERLAEEMSKEASE